MTALQSTIQAEVPEPSTRAELHEAIRRVLKEAVEAEQRARRW